MGTTFSSKVEKLKSLDRVELVKAVGITLALLVASLFLLYTFIFSVSLLTVSVRLLTTPFAGEIFVSEAATNRLIGSGDDREKHHSMGNHTTVFWFLLGDLATIITQSSSVITSITASLVKDNRLGLREAFPVIMGSNLGTCITSTLVSLTLIKDKTVLRRGFAVATMHDMLNFLTAMVFIQIDSIATLGGGRCGVMEYITNKITWQESDNQHNEEACNRVPSTPSDAVNFRFGVDSQDSDRKSNHTDSQNTSGTLLRLSNFTYNGYIVEPLINKIIQFNDIKEQLKNDSDDLYWKVSLKKCGDGKNSFLLCNWYERGNDCGLGLLLLGISAALLGFNIWISIWFSKLLIKDSRMKDSNFFSSSKDTGFVRRKLIELVFIFIGMGATLICQSSSILSSALVPLAANKIISLGQAYCLILGSNIGTTSTSWLSSLRNTRHMETHAFQIFLGHLLFNLTGLLLFYPIECLRLPLIIAKQLGETVAIYRWFAVVYILLVFFLIPSLLFALSLHPILLLFSLHLSLFIILILIIINLLQEYRNGEYLPAFLSTWTFLPQPLHSLEPYDRALRRIFRLRPRQDLSRASFEFEEMGRFSLFTAQK